MIEGAQAREEWSVGYLAGRRLEQCVEQSVGVLRESGAWGRCYWEWGGPGKPFPCSLCP